MACLARMGFVIFITPHLYLSTSPKADVLLLQKQLFGKLFFFLPFFQLERKYEKCFCFTKRHTFTSEFGA